MCYEAKRQNMLSYNPIHEESLAINSSIRVRKARGMFFSGTLGAVISKRKRPLFGCSFLCQPGNYDRG